MFRKAVLIASVLFAANFTPASASPIDTPSARVRLGDVNPETDAGAQMLLRRIERAAREVCGEHVARRYASTRRAYRRCTQLTIADTIDRIGSERLYAEFVTRYGHI